MQIGVFGRFLLIASALWMLALAAIATYFQWSSHDVAREELDHKLNSVSAAYALLLAENMASGDYGQIGDHTLSLLIDKDIASFAIKGPDGAVVESFGELEPNHPFDKKVPIRYADDTGVTTVGAIRIQMNTDRLDEHLALHTQGTLSLLLVAFFVSLAASAGAYWFSVGRPINSLIEAIRRFQVDGEHRDVPVHANDQLGEVIQEYNRMQRIALKQKERLVKSHHGLEREVTERTEQLKQNKQELHRTSEQLAYLSKFDALTDLPNHRAFQEKVRMWMLDLHKTGDRGAICVLGLDNFAEINEMAGHPGGDAFLASVAKLLQLKLRPQDFLARLVGDEFVLLIHGSDETAVKEICEAMRVDVYRHRYEVSGTLLQTGISIGIYGFSDAETTYDEALAQAEQACRRAKSDGGNRLFFA